MATPAERRALVLVTVVICLGVAARVSRATRSGPPPTAAERLSLDRQIARVESARAAVQGDGSGGRDRRSEPRKSASTAPEASTATGARVVLEPRLTLKRRHPESGNGRLPVARELSPIDVDAASASELERLPYVGQALAARIVANRDSCGGFGSLEALQRVRGIGEGLARRLAPLVTFSSPSRPMGTAGTPGCARADKRAAARQRGRHQ